MVFWYNSNWIMATNIDTMKIHETKVETNKKLIYVYESLNSPDYVHRISGILSNMFPKKKVLIKYIK
jgi:hypothetical protein